MKRPTMPTGEITPDTVLQQLPTKDGTVAGAVADALCARAKRPTRAVDKQYVCRALRDLEADGRARVVGQQRVVNGRPANLWVRVEPSLFGGAT